MKRQLILFATLLGALNASPSAVADDPAALIGEETLPVIQIQSLSADTDVSHLEDGFSGADYAAVKSLPSALPSAASRDRAIAAAGLADKTLAMDHLDRDLLYLRLKLGDLSELRKNYPQLGLQKIKQALAAFAEHQKKAGNR